MSEETNTIVRGKRYTTEEKREIIDFVNEYNATNGRGGQTAASKKYSVSALTISNWLKSQNGSSVISKAKGNLFETLNQMSSIGKEIDDLEAQIIEKRKQFNELKKALG